jgi:hypothetical protein
MAAGMIVLLFRGEASPPRSAATKHTGSAFPAWGLAGAVILLAGWWLAWSRFAWFSPFQAHTFCLPWIGYILTVNAWCVRRSGSSPMTRAPGRFIALFPASALFWWFFEYLNRFAQNWCYLGTETYSPSAYIVHASLAFSTVLPAVLSTTALLLTWPRFDTGLTRLFRIRPPRGKGAALAGLAVSSFGLALIGRFPDYLFPLVWVAPLMVIVSLQAFSGRATIFSGLRDGDWRQIVAPALAALICGLFWELWNVNSLARWEYAVPFVDCCHVFAMPLLGYGGYPPFGLECLVAGRLILEKEPLWL